MTDYTDQPGADLEDAVDEAVRDVRRGAKRVGRAVVDGVDAVDEALRPSFWDEACGIARSLAEDPEETPNLVRDILHNHPIASLLTATTVGFGIAKLIGAVRARR